MNRNRKQFGFSLTEMLIAVGIMAIGLVMVAMVFPVGVKLTTLTTERTLGAVVADEAFAKIQLYGLRDFQNWPAAIIAQNTNNLRYAPNWENATYDTCTDFIFASKGILGTGADGIYATADDEFLWPGPDGSFGTPDDFPDTSYAFLGEFLYPSSVVPVGQEQNYHWSALCRRTGDKSVLVTVFVTRKIAPASLYRSWNYDPVNVNDYAANSNSIWPKPVPVSVIFDPAFPNRLTIADGPAFTAAESGYFFDDGYTIVNDFGNDDPGFLTIYRVLEVRDDVPDALNTPDTLVLQQNWMPGPNTPNETIWVVPPAVGSDRYPCVGVYQKEIRFDEIN